MEVLKYMSYISNIKASIRVSDFALITKSKILFTNLIFAHAQVTQFEKQVQIASDVVIFIISIFWRHVYKTDCLWGHHGDSEFKMFEFCSRHYSGRTIGNASFRVFPQHLHWFFLIAWDWSGQVLRIDRVCCFFYQ